MWLRCARSVSFLYSLKDFYRNCGNFTITAKRRYSKSPSRDRFCNVPHLGVLSSIEVFPERASRNLISDNSTARRLQLITLGSLFRFILNVLWPQNVEFQGLHVLVNFRECSMIISKYRRRKFFECYLGFEPQHEHEERIHTKIYKIHLLEELISEDDSGRRIEFCETMMHIIHQDGSFINCILFSDESTFYLNGHNCRYWSDPRSDQDPHWIEQVHTQRSQKIHIWPEYRRSFLH